MQSNIMRDLNRNLEGYLSLVLLIVYTAVIAQDIFRRWFLGSQTNWGLEVTLMLFTWMTWLAASFAIQRESHFRFTLIRERLSQKLNYYLHYLDTFLWVAISSAIIYYSYFELVSRMATPRNILGTPIPSYVAYIAIPVGFVLILFRAIQKLYVIRKRFKNDENVKPDSSI